MFRITFPKLTHEFISILYKDENFVLWYLWRYPLPEYITSADQSMILTLPDIYVGYIFSMVI